MSQITISGQTYDFDLLPEDAKNQVLSLNFVEAELQRLNAQIAVYMTARSAYTRAFNEIVAVKPE